MCVEAKEGTMKIFCIDLSPSKWPAINIKVILSSAAISCILINYLLQGPHIWYQSTFLGSLGEISAQIFFCFYCRFGSGNNPYLLKCGKYLAISPKTHCEEYHRNPEVAGPLRGPASEKGNDPYLID